MVRFVKKLSVWCATECNLDECMGNVCKYAQVEIDDEDEIDLDYACETCVHGEECALRQFPMQVWCDGYEEEVPE